MKQPASLQERISRACAGHTAKRLRRMQMAREYLDTLTERPSVLEFARALRLNNATASALIYEKFGPKPEAKLRVFIAKSDERPAPCVVAEMFGVNVEAAQRSIYLQFGPSRKAVAK